MERIEGIKITPYKELSVGTEHNKLTTAGIQATVTQIDKIQLTPDERCLIIKAEYEFLKRFLPGDKSPLDSLRRVAGEVTV